MSERAVNGTVAPMNMNEIRTGKQHSSNCRRLRCRMLAADHLVLIGVRGGRLFDHTSPMVTAECQRSTIMALPVHELLPNESSAMISHIMNDTNESTEVRK